MKDYSDAFAEVCKILSHLEEDAYNKIPKDFIQMIEENRNPEHEFIVYEDIELKDHEMLPETRAILFNMFRDYLCTSEQKEKILKMQAEERRKSEEKKRQEYYENKPQEEIEPLKEERQVVELIQMEYKETFWTKIKNMISAFFTKK